MIRKASLSEYVKLESIFTNYFDTFKLEVDNPFTHVYVFEEKEIMGFICYSEIYERCELDYLAVIKNYQEQKIASKLVETMILKTGKKEISLEVNVKNKKAIGLYEKYGFTIVSKRNNYYQQDDAYVMVLSR